MDGEQKGGDVVSEAQKLDPHQCSLRNVITDSVFLLLAPRVGFLEATACLGQVNGEADFCFKNPLRDLLRGPGGFDLTHAA